MPDGEDSFSKPRSEQVEEEVALPILGPVLEVVFEDVLDAPWIRGDKHGTVCGQGPGERKREREGERKRERERKGGRERGRKDMWEGENQDDASPDGSVVWCVHACVYVRSV